MKKKQIIFKTTKPNSKKYEYVDHIWDLEDQLDQDFILGHPSFSNFKYAATVVKSDTTSGYDILVDPEFKDKPFVIYLVFKNGKLLKGGKAKNGLANRSYRAGTEESWTMRGTPSVTNYVWSQIFRESLNDGHPITFYGYVVPSSYYTYTSFDGEIITELVAGHYESEEKKLNNLLNTINGKKVIGEGNLLAKFKK